MRYILREKILLGETIFHSFDKRFKLVCYNKFVLRIISEININYSNCFERLLEQRFRAIIRKLDKGDFEQ